MHPAFMPELLAIYHEEIFAHISIRDRYLASYFFVVETGEQKKEKVHRDRELREREREARST